MAPTVVNTWSGTWAVPVDTEFPAPSLQGAACEVANTGATGNWMLAICTWRNPAGFATSVSVSDNARNWWEPLGSPAGTSAAGGLVRISVWASPCPFPATNVYAAPIAFAQAVDVTVIEVSGMSPWLALAQLAAVEGNSVSGLSALSLLAPSSQALVLTACGTDNNTYSASLAGSGWTALASTVASNGSDDTSDLTLWASWQAATGATTATWSASGALNMAAIAIVLIAQPAAPAASGNPNWPYMQVQAGFGAGARTPWDAISWTTLTARWRGMQGQRGQQYELDTIQSGVTNHILNNNDGALTPGYVSSPFYPSVSVYTPFRVLATWPLPPSAQARTYVVHRGFMERWPQSLTETRYQLCNAVSTDVWATLTTLQDTILREEMLQDLPWAYWPLSDLAGASYGINYASTTAGPIEVVATQGGVGSATYSFAADPGAYLIGDPSGTVWSQSGMPSTQTTEGYCLYYQDSTLPNINNGITLDCWFQVEAAGPNTDNILYMLRCTSGAICQVYIGNPNGANPGQVMIAVWDKSTRVRTNYVVNGTNFITAGNPIRVALLLTQSTWQVVINGGWIVSGNSGTCNVNTAWAWITAAGISDRFYQGGMWNGLVGHLAIYPRLLPLQRLLSHYWAGIMAFGGSDTASMRMERLLAASNSGIPRYIGATPDLIQGALDIQGQASGQNLTNIAETDSGLMVCDSGGYLRYISRRTGYNLPVSVTLGEGENETPMNSNPQFSPATVAPWGATGGTVASSTAVPGPYTYSALLTPSGGTPAYLSDSAVPVTQGQSYVMAAWVYSPTGYSQAYLGFQWQTSGSSTVATVTASAAVPAKVWTLLMTTQTVPYGESITQAVPVVGESGTPAGTNLLYVQNAAMTLWEAPYLGDVGLDYDPSQVYNDVQLTQFSAPQAIAGADVGITCTIQSAASMLAYGDQDLQETVYLYSPTAVGDLANWILYTSDQPLIRVSQITLDPASNPALWPLVLAIEVGWTAVVNRRLWQLLQMSLPGQVMSVAHDVSPGKWQCKLTVVTYTGQVLECDSPVYGQLNGSNRLPW